MATQLLMMRLVLVCLVIGTCSCQKYGGGVHVILLYVMAALTVKPFHQVAARRREISKVA